jgi:hypothetical protein
MMDSQVPDTLSIAYTYGIAGDLSFLPRLATRLRALRPLIGTPLLLDLGASCTPEVWHCAATEGRSMVVALDGLGYHAINVQGLLSADGRHKLSGVVTAGMLDERHTWRLKFAQYQDEGIVVAHAPMPALRLCIVCAPAPTTTLEGGVLTLQAPPARQIGVVQLALNPQAHIVTTAHYLVADNTPPDPSIAASIEFIEDEARSALGRQR